jgi:hypothetical protein
MEVDLPTDEDIRKLNAEILQTINQRFSITLTAITIFGAMSAWIIPKIPSVTATEGIGFIYYISSLLLLLLLFLFYYSYILRGRAKVISTYLIITESSNWEIAWNKFKRPGVHFSAVVVVYNCVSCGTRREYLVCRYSNI